MVVSTEIFKKVIHPLFTAKRPQTEAGLRRFGKVNPTCEQLPRWIISAKNQRVFLARLPAEVRTDSTDFGRGFGTRISGQPSKPKARRSSPARYLAYAREKSS